MRLAIASSGLGHVSRGIEAWADDLATALVDRGENVILCKGAGKTERPFERVVNCWKRDDASTRRLARALPKRLLWRIGLGGTYGVEQTTFALGLIRLLRRERIDVLHVQDPQTALLVQRARTLGIVRTKTILAHGTEEPAEFLRRIHYLQHLAPWHLDRTREAGAWRPTWTAIPNFIDAARFRPGRSDDLRRELGIPLDATVVLSSAAIKRDHKRIDYLIAEFAALRENRPDLPVWLIVAGGREGETDELVKEGERLLGDRVRFLVSFPRDRMPELYRAADVFSLCSLFEMMPIALIEAAASGLPCVVNDHPILRWMTGAGGVVSDLSQPGALASAMESLADDASRRSTIGTQARNHCEAHFGKDAVVDRILEYYRFVSGAPRRANEAACVSA